MGETIWGHRLVISLSDKVGFNRKWGYILLAFFLSFPIPVSRVFIFVLIFSRLIALKVERKNLSNLRNTLFQYLLPILFLVYALSLVYSTNFTYGLKQLEKAFPLLLVSLSFTYDEFSDTDRVKILKSFIYGIITMCFFLLGKAFYNSLYLQDGSLLFDPRVLRDPRITYIHSVNWGGNHFFSDAFIDFMHPSYFGMYLVFSLACLFYLFKGNHLSSKATGIFSFLLLFILFLSSSRASHLSLVLVAVVILIDDELFSRKKKAFTFTIVIAVLALFVIFNPRWLEFSGLQDMREGKIEYRGSVPERLMSWDASINLIQENVLYGYGIGDVQSELNRTYTDLNYQRPLYESYNAHNQFLQTFLCAGIMGFVVLLLVFLRLFVLYKQTNHLLILVFALVVVIHFSFESMLERYAGVVFFAFFYALFNALNLKKLDFNDCNN